MIATATLRLDPLDTVRHGATLWDGMGQQWYTPKEAAEYLRVTRSTIYRWTNEGRLHAHEFPSGGGRRYKREELDGLLGDSKSSGDTAATA